MAAEAVKVIVRCRPMNDREKNLKCKLSVSMNEANGQCSITHPTDVKNVKTFTFDGAYFTQSTTEQIYADIGYPLVEGVTEGYNGTIFAYGQTGCGKSFSMQGIQDPPTQRGIIPRAFDHIFETITSVEKMKFLVHASYLEIYNEEIRDLLAKDVKHKLDLKEHPDRGVYVQGLSMHPCKNVRDCEHIMDRGWKNRSTGATLMNADSSRSHSIFTIHLEMCEADDKGEEHIRAGKLNLVDLAGSERQTKTGATGDRLKEATKINLSLSALGNVISALVDGKSKHIPYRDSKLTRLLQDSLGGNTKTLMVACLSPADNNYDETLSTLRYANRAKNIKNKPKINEDPKDALLREYQDEINRLKAMLRGEIPIEIDANFRHVGGISGDQKPAAKTKVVEKVVHVKDEEEIQREKERIKEEYEEQMVLMKAEFEEMRISKEKMEEEMSKMKEHYDLQIASVDQQVESPGQAVQPATKKSGQKVAAGAAMTNGHAAPSSQKKSRSIEQEGTVTNGLEEECEEAGETEGAVPPCSSPTGEDATKAVVVQQEQALRRLQELQEQMVGGEQANNSEVKERRKRKKRHAEERMRKLKEALASMDGDEIMLNIYDNVQDELKVKNKLLEKQKKKNVDLQTEIKDLQTEFEFDRIDYLDTIRKQERQVKLLQAIIDRIHPCIRRDCNYANLDRVKALCEWDEDKQMWMLPPLTVEKTKLPPAGNIMPGGREPNQRARPPPTYTNGDLESEDKYLQKLHNSTEQDIANNYFKSKRADKLLNKSQEDKNRVLRNISPSSNTIYAMTNGSSNSLSSMGGSWNSEPMTHEQLRAANVHGQLNGEDLLRRPTRLDALPQPSSGDMRKKKKKKNFNVMEQY